MMCLCMWYMHCIREYHRRCRDLNDAYKPCAYIKCFFSIFRIFGSKKIAILECTKKSLKHSPSDSSSYIICILFSIQFSFWILILIRLSHAKVRHTKSVLQGCWAEFTANHLLTLMLIWLTLNMVLILGI